MEIRNSGTECKKEYGSCEGTEAGKNNRSGEKIEIYENEKRLMASERKLTHC